MEHLRLENERLRNEQRHQLNLRQQELNNAVSRASQDYAYLQEQQKLEIERKRQEAAHLIQLLEMQLETAKIENDHTYKVEQLNVLKLEMQSLQIIELARLQDTRETTRRLNDVLLKLLDKDLHIVDFTYLAVISSSLIKSEELPLPILDKLASAKQKMLLYEYEDQRDNQNAFKAIQEANQTLTEVLTPIIKEVPLEVENRKLSNREVLLYGVSIFLAILFASQTIYLILYAILFILGQIIYYFLYCPVFAIFSLIYLILYWPVVIVWTILCYLIMLVWITCCVVGACCFVVEWDTKISKKIKEM